MGFLVCWLIRENQAKMQTFCQLLVFVGVFWSGVPQGHSALALLCSRGTVEWGIVRRVLRILFDITYHTDWAEIQQSVCRWCLKKKKKSICCAKSNERQTTVNLPPAGVCCRNGVAMTSEHTFHRWINLWPEWHKYVDWEKNGATTNNIPRPHSNDPHLLWGCTK